MNVMKKRAGFTLIEIMIVIIIIVMIGSISFTSWFSITQNISGEGTLNYVVQALENILIKARFDSFQKKDVYTLSFYNDRLVIPDSETSDETIYTFPDEVSIKNPVPPYKYNRGFFTNESNQITPDASFTLEYKKGSITQEKVFSVIGGLPQTGDQ
jgi:prepilin-type N-terminal cleavage/methylation domain-containing protein